MKVLFVCSGNLEFGINPIVKNQGESLRKNGVDVDYFAIKGKGVIGYIKNIPRLKIKLKSIPYDLIHAHYGYSGIVAYFAKRKQKIIVSFMGSDLLGGVSSKCKKAFYNKLSLKIHQIFAKHYYDFNITKTENLKLQLKSKNVAVIPNGVDFEKFFPLDITGARRNLNLPLDKKIVLFVAYPARPEKNFKLAYYAFNLVSNQNAELIPVYDKTQEVLNYYYNASDLLLLTSLYEGSPNVIKEAMACNLPIVSTDVGDVKKLITGTQGCYITSFDPNDITEKIKLALDFRKRTDGRERIQHLEINRAAKIIIELYEKTLLEK